MKSDLPASRLVAKLTAFPRLPEILAILAGLVYLVQSIGFAYTQWSVVDEGNYAYKGWLFVTGQYTPFQDYGVWTNHMPFSFLILGAVQFLFGPGIRTIRYFMVVVGCLLLLALWLTSRRLAGRWAAAVCLWFVALNPFPISDYSVGIAEGPVACILAWTLYFTLGENRSKRELIIGGLLAGVLVLTRENMVLVLPFLCAYVFWQRGRKAGLLYTGVAAALLLAIHVVYFPGILRVWATWTPKSLRPLFGDWVYQGVGRLDHEVSTPFLKNLQVVANTVQSNFLTLFPALAVWLSWPKDGFRTTAQHKLVVALSVMLAVLLLGHSWASLTKDYCSYCLVNYVTFFSPVALLLFVAFLPGIRERRPFLPAWLVALVILVVTIGIGYSNYDRYGDALASLPVPRGLGLETTELWKILYNKFNLDVQLQRRLLPPLVGLLAGLLIVGLALLWAKRSKVTASYNLIFLTILVGAVLSPTLMLGGVEKSCDQDVIAGYERVGAQLAKVIPPGTKVYWRGDGSPMSLLYVPGIKIYPPQLNGYFSIRPEQDLDEVLRFGFWNNRLNLKWRAEADVLLIREAEVPSIEAFLTPKRFQELEKTSPVFACSPDTSIHIFERK